MFDQVVILYGEIRYLSLLEIKGVKGLCHLFLASL